MLRTRVVYLYSNVCCDLLASYYYTPPHGRPVTSARGPGSRLSRSGRRQMSSSGTRLTAHWDLACGSRSNPNSLVLDKVQGTYQALVTSILTRLHQQPSNPTPLACTKYCVSPSLDEAMPSLAPLKATEYADLLRLPFPSPPASPTKLESDTIRLGRPVPLFRPGECFSLPMCG